MNLLRRYDPEHQAWIAKHMPELAKRLGPLDAQGVRAVLNEVTGLNVQGNERISDGMELFMARLKEMKQ